METTASYDSKFRPCGQASRKRPHRLGIWGGRLLEVRLAPASITNIFVLFVEATSCEGLPNTDIRKNHESSKRNHKQENEPSQVFAPPNGGHGRYRPEGNQNPMDSGKRETKICSEENNVEERNATATPMTEKANALNTADNHDSVSMTEQKHIKEVVGLKGSSSTEGQVIYSSGPFGEHYETRFLVEFVFTVCFRYKTVLASGLEKETILLWNKENCLQKHLSEKLFGTRKT